MKPAIKMGSLLAGGIMAMSASHVAAAQRVPAKPAGTVQAPVAANGKPVVQQAPAVMPVTETTTNDARALERGPAPTRRAPDVQTSNVQTSNARIVPIGSLVPNGLAPTRQVLTPSTVVTAVGGARVSGRTSSPSLPVGPLLTPVIVGNIGAVKRAPGVSTRSEPVKAKSTSTKPPSL